MSILSILVQFLMKNSIITLWACSKGSPFDWQAKTCQSRRMFTMYHIFSIRSVVGLPLHSLLLSQLHPLHQIWNLPVSNQTGNSQDNADNKAKLRPQIGCSQTDGRRHGDSVHLYIQSVVLINIMTVWFSSLNVYEASSFLVAGEVGHRLTV